jgi:hypothetical protein
MLKFAAGEVGRTPVGRSALVKLPVVLTGPEVAHPEYRSRIEADRCTWQFSDKIRPEKPQESVESLPLFGGERQKNLFGGS